MHSFSNAQFFLTLAFISVILSMSFWWRDVISEGKLITITSTILEKKIKTISVRAISKEDVLESLSNRNIGLKKVPKDQLGYYLAGLLEGDGYISIPALGNTSLNRLLNPRIIFTSHINNLPLYAYIQSELNDIGRFQRIGTSGIRYIIGDVKGITLFINLIHNKLRTPKNITFNKLIGFINKKYNLSIEESILDKSDLSTNSWFTGFTEANGNFYIKIIESKNKSNEGKRSVSVNISFVFRLDQRSFDKPTSSSMIFIMEELASFLNVELKKYELKNKTNKEKEMLSVSVTSLYKLKKIIAYFNDYYMLGNKHSDFLAWEKAYYMFITKEHLTETGINKIRLIKNNMNNKRIS